MRGAGGPGRGQIMLPESEDALERYEAKRSSFLLRKRLLWLKCAKRLESEDQED